MRRSLLLTVSGCVLLSLHPEGRAGTGDELDRSALGKLTFSEEMEAPPGIYQPETRQGTWETKYWFGDPNGISSRTWDGLVDIAVDEAYAGVKSWELKEGVLHLISYRVPRPEDPVFAGREFTQSVLTTARSFSQQYGYFEACLQYPDDPGFWPCFWLWSREGGLGNEIDIAEGQTAAQDKIYNAIHLRHTWKEAPGGEMIRKELTDTVAVPVEDIGKPHVYGLLWTAEELVWYRDGQETLRRRNEGFHDPMFLILSMGMGGWEEGNKPGPETKLPNRFLIDWVRVYELKP
jgi:serralysin